MVEKIEHAWLEVIINQTMKYSSYGIKKITVLKLKVHWNSQTLC